METPSEADAGQPAPSLPLAAAPSAAEPDGSAILAQPLMRASGALARSFSLNFEEHAIGELVEPSLSVPDWAVRLEGQPVVAVAMERPLTGGQLPCDTDYLVVPPDDKEIRLVVEEYNDVSGVARLRTKSELPPHAQHVAIVIASRNTEWRFPDRAVGHVAPLGLLVPGDELHAAIRYTPAGLLAREHARAQSAPKPPPYEEQPWFEAVYLVPARLRYRERERQQQAILLGIPQKTFKKGGLPLSVPVIAPNYPRQVFHIHRECLANPDYKPKSLPEGIALWGLPVFSWYDGEESQSEPECERGEDDVHEQEKSGPPQSTQPSLKQILSKPRDACSPTFNEIQVLPSDVEKFQARALDDVRIYGMYAITVWSSPYGAAARPAPPAGELTTYEQLCRAARFAFAYQRGKALIDQDSIALTLHLSIDFSPATETTLSAELSDQDVATLRRRDTTAIGRERVLAWKVGQPLLLTVVTQPSGKVCALSGQLTSLVVPPRSRSSSLTIQLDNPSHFFVRATLRSVGSVRAQVSMPSFKSAQLHQLAGLIWPVQKPSSMTKAIANLFVGRLPTDHRPIPLPSVVPADMRDMDVEQQIAINGLTASPPFVSIIGGPGAGKTVLIVRFLLRLFNPSSPLRMKPKAPEHHREPRLLIIAAANAALRALLEKMRKHPELRVHVARAYASTASDYEAEFDIRNRARAEAARRDIVAHSLVEDATTSLVETTGDDDDAQARRLCSGTIATACETAVMDALSSAPPAILMATVASFATLPASLRRRYNMLLLDEATQLNLAELVVVAHALPKLGQVILAGDPQQLGPYHRDYRGLLASSMLSSALAFLTRPTGRADQHYTVEYRLHRNYRSHPVLVEHAVRPFYPNMVAGRDAGSFPLLADIRFPVAGYPLLWLDTASTTTYSADEQEVLAALLTRLAQLDVDVGGSVVVLTMHRSTVDSSVATIEALQLATSLRCQTLDESRGEQFPIVVLLLSKALVNGDTLDAQQLRNRLSYVADPRRVHVAVSRATDALFIVGDATLLEGHATWAGMIARWREIGLVRQREAIELLVKQHPQRPCPPAKRPSTSPCSGPPAARRRLAVLARPMTSWPEDAPTTSASSADGAASSSREEACHAPSTSGERAE